MKDHLPFPRYNSRDKDRMAFIRKVSYIVPSRSSYPPTSGMSCSIEMLDTYIRFILLVVVTMVAYGCVWLGKNAGNRRKKGLYTSTKENKERRGIGVVVEVKNERIV